MTTNLKKENDKIYITLKLTIPECEKLKILDKLIEELECSFKENGETEKLVYLDKKVRNLSNTKMQLIWGYSKRHLNRIISNVEKTL